MERLVQFGKVSRGYLGVNIQSVSPELQEQFNLPDQAGAIVTDVRPGTPAAKAGLQNYDVIRELNGKKVEDSRQLRLAISQNAPGAKVTMKVLRGEPGHKLAEKTVTATLGTLHPEDLASGNRQMGPAEEENTSAQDALDGVEVTDVDSSARRQLNLPTSVSGALVTSVEPDSNSAEAGLHQGDVILEIDRHPVRNADDAVELAKQAKDKRVGLRIWREGGSLLLSVDNSKKEREKQG
jgi:S1-C subfamily serine protease